MLKKIFNDCFTGANNETFDLYKFIIVFAFLFYCGLSVADVLKTRDFEYREFAEGAAIIIGVGGLSLYVKKDTEPK